MATTRRRRCAAAAVVGLGLVVLTLAGCGDAEPSNPTLDDVAIDTRHPAVTVAVNDAGYSRERIEVAPGDVIQFENTGSGPHSFTGASRFDTGRLQPGETSLLVLDEPGEIPFSDLEAPSHKGVLVISAPR
jgi:plastocyanin